MSTVLTVPGSGFIAFDNRPFDPDVIPGILDLSNSVRLGHDNGEALVVSSEIPIEQGAKRFVVEGTNGEIFYVIEGPTNTLYISGAIATDNGTSDLWNTTYSVVCALSSSWDINSTLSYLSTNQVTLCSIDVKGQILSAGIDKLDDNLNRKINPLK